MERRLGRLARLSIAGAMILAVAAPASAASNSMVRVLHGSPDAPEVDVYVNGDKVDALSGLSFGDLSAYVAVPGGTYAIKVCATADATVCPIDVAAAGHRVRHPLHHRGHQRPRQHRGPGPGRRSEPDRRQGPGSRRPLLRRHARRRRPDPGQVRQGGREPRLPQRHRLPDAGSGQLRPHRLRQRGQHGLPARPGRPRPRGRQVLLGLRDRLAHR